MRVVVTGGSGKLGRAVVHELATHGWDVANVDAAPPRDARSAFTRVDLTDFGQVVEAFSRVDSRYDAVDAVVHLAAIPGPGNATNAATFATTSSGPTTSSPLLVRTGSETSCGLRARRSSACPSTSRRPTSRWMRRSRAPGNHYSLGKVLDEEMARHFCRWDPDLKMIGLRFSNVMEPADYAQFPAWNDDPTIRQWNLWSYIDARDGAQAVRRALEHEAAGMDVFIIANADTVMSRPNDELVRMAFRMCRSAARSASTTRCSRSRRRGESSATHQRTAGAQPEGGLTPQSGDRRVAAKSHMTVISATSSSAITSSALPTPSSTSHYLRAGSDPHSLPKDTDGSNSIRTRARGTAQRDAWRIRSTASSKDSPSSCARTPSSSAPALAVPASFPTNAPNTSRR